MYFTEFLVFFSFLYRIFPTFFRVLQVFNRLFSALMYFFRILKVFFSLFLLLDHLQDHLLDYCQWSSKGQQLVEERWGEEENPINIPDGPCQGGPACFGFLGGVLDNIWISWFHFFSILNNEHLRECFQRTLRIKRRIPGTYALFTPSSCHLKHH